MTGDRHLSQGWVDAPLSEIADVIMGQSPPGSTYNTDGVGLPFYQGKAEFGAYSPTPRKWCSAPSRIAEEGDILLSVRAPVGSVNVCVERSAIGRGLAALRPHNRLPSKYLFYALQASERQLRERATGTTFEAVSGDTVRNHRIPLGPVESRAGVVEFIDRQLSRIDEAVALMASAGARLSMQREGILARALASAKTQSLADLCAVIADCEHRTPLYGSGEIPALRPRDVVRGALDLENAGRVSEAEYQRQIRRHRPAAGDVAYSRELSYGWAVVLPDYKLCLGQGMVIFRAGDRVLPDWIVLYLNSRAGREQAARAATGSAHPHINLSSIKEYQIPAPPKETQYMVLAEASMLLAAIDKLNAEISAAAAKTSPLRQAVLRAAFRSAGLAQAGPARSLH